MKSFGQYTCSSATQIAADIENEYSFTSTYTEYWFKFIAVDSINSISCWESASNPQAEIIEINLYDGNCNNLNLVSSISDIDTLSFTEILLAGDTFYIEITRSGIGTGYFGFSLFDSHMDTWSMQTPDCDLVGNGCFTTITGGYNPLYPFGPPSYVHDWNSGLGSPVIGSTSSPIYYFAAMWGRRDGGTSDYRAECIYQDIGQLPTGNTYTIKLKYKTTTQAPFEPPPDEICVWLTDDTWPVNPQNSGTAVGASIVPNMNHQDMFATSLTPVANFTQAQSTFMVNSNYTYERLVIFPKQNITISPYAAWLYVDCIELVPSETVTITSNPCPTISKGTSIQLTANLSGNYTGTYSWNTSATTQNITVNPTTTTTYSVTVTYANNCTATEEIQVVVVDAGPDKNICSGQNVQIGTTALLNYSYSWSPATYIYQSCTTCAEPWIVQPSATTTYTVTATNTVNNCSATDDVVVYVTTSSYNASEPIPYINSSSPSNNICHGNTINYSIANPQAYHEYTWKIIPANAGSITSPVAPIPLTSNSVTIQWTNIPVTGATIHVVGFNKNNCDSNSYDYKVFNCCTDHNPDYIFMDEAISQTGTSFVSKVIDINGTLEIDDDVFWGDCEVYLGPDAKINIQSGFTLEIRRHSVLTDCDDNNMWDGIYIQDENTNLIVVEGSSILNAKNAVVSNDGGVFNITDSYIEENYKGIVVNNCGADHEGYVENT
ncbi:hypothetical protein ACFL6I_28545, partial [candidate division KSB1 bacterium]